MTDLWMPGATKHDLGDHAPTDPQYPAKVIAHITWDKNASASAPQDLVPYETLVSVFSGSEAGMAPHILWDPFTGRFTQFFPADSRSKSVVDLPGGTRTNRAGKVVIQIEALFFPYCRVNGKVYAKLTDTPLKGWNELHAWIKSLGVPDVWPMGKPNGSSQRNESVWETKGGWYGHSQVPENTHTDPISWPDFPVNVPSKPGPVPTPVYAPFPGKGFFHLGQHNDLITEMGKALIRAGYKAKYTPTPDFTRADLAAYSWWQRKLGYSGSDADGYPGPDSWAKLKVASPKK